MRSFPRVLPVVEGVFQSQACRRGVGKDLGAQDGMTPQSDARGSVRGVVLDSVAGQSRERLRGSAGDKG
jgi:hypothetical protein